MSALQTDMFSEVNPFLWKLPCDLCIKEARAVRGVTSCGDVFLEKKKKSDKEVAARLSHKTEEILTVLQIPPTEDSLTFHLLT